MNPNPRPAIGPMSVGNVVSAGFVLYRSHLKSYFRIALFASLWILLPFLLIIPLPVLFISRVVDLSALWLIIPLWLVLGLYCWAQYLTSSALISRLGFGELVSKPEGVNEGRNQVKSRLWSYLFLGFLVGILLVGVYFLLAIIAFIIGGILGFILGFVNPALGAIFTGLLVFIIVLGGITWFYSRWLVAEVVLAVEDGRKVVESINRSWQLTKNSAFRIQGAVLVAFLVTLPILLLSAYLPQLLLINVEPNSVAFWTLYAISLVISMAGNVLVMPFWQTLKAVIYYDLRSRREGLGLQLRDSR
jgi:MFS family permease